MAEDGDDEDADEPNVIRVPGEIGSIIERLSKEYTKAHSRLIPAHTPLPGLRMKASSSLAERVQQYYTRGEKVLPPGSVTTD